SHTEKLHVNADENNGSGFIAENSGSPVIGNLISKFIKSTPVGNVMDGDSNKNPI
ncbi:hypothetical protein L9F63_010009, partial [Diploptera punctata]